MHSFSGTRPTGAGRPSGGYGGYGGNGGCGGYGHFGGGAAPSAGATAPAS
jgi:hypothetical protein